MKIKIKTEVKGNYKNGIQTVIIGGVATLISYLIAFGLSKLK